MTSDPANKTIPLIITGPVKAYAAIEPSRVRISVNVNETVQKTITIVPDKDFPFKAVSVGTRHKDPNLQCSLNTLSGTSGTSYTVDLTYTASRSGSFSNSLIVKTDNPDVPELLIPVSGYVMTPRTESAK